VQRRLIFMAGARAALEHCVATILLTG
jgi:hypothetical protein